MEYRIRINRYGTVNIFRIYPDGCLRFTGYARSLEQALEYCRKLPTIIVVTSDGL